jgi:TrmH family RNA methyltransferase
MMHSGQGSKLLMITSKKNPRLQFIRSLIQDRKTREESNLFVIEGVRLVEDAVIHNADISEVFFSNALSERGKSLVDDLFQKDIIVEEVEESVLLSILDTSNPQGIAAICRIPEIKFSEHSDFVIIADQIRDPGNLGTLLRTAASAGAQAVITTRGSVDLFSPKVVRSAMGAHFHLTCFEADWEEIKVMLHANRTNPLTVYSATAQGEKNYWDCGFKSPTLLIIGSEADGVSKTALEISDFNVSIPMPGNFESLNAAVAAGIIIFEVVRQRTK